MADGATPLRIALVTVPGWLPRGWQALVIDRILADPRLMLAGRITSQADAAPVPPPRLVRATMRAERALSRFITPHYPADAARQAVTALADLGHDPGAGAPADLALALDRFRLAPDQLPLAGLGEWSLAAGGVDGAIPDWLLLAPDACTDGAIPIEIRARRADRPGPVVLDRADFNPKLLASLTAEFLREKAALFLLRALTHQAQAPAPTSAQTAPPLAAPARLALANYAARVSKGLARRLDDRLREGLHRGRAHWRLAIGTGDALGLEPARAIDLPRQQYSMADPFLFDHAGALHLFYEAQDSANGRGWIEAARLDGDRLVPLGPALRCDYHLSFPQVFATGGAIYMLPETQGNRRLEIWRATDFPLRWTLHATAFQGQYLADSTLFLHAGQWWLFTNLSDHALFQEHSSSLHLFAVDGPDLRRIVPHPLNPVVMGSPVARNAGSVIVQDGRLIRPSQINAHGVYGYGLNLMEIERLDFQGYREKLVRRFTPADRPGAAGLHHLSVAGGRHVFDWFSP